MAEAVGLKTFFSIRQYTARIRSVDSEKCWPFSELEENKSLPQMTWRRHKWWSSELDSVGSVSPELKGVGEELDDDDDDEVGVPGTTPKKRSIVELFAIAPQIAGRGEEEEDEDDSEKDAGLIEVATKRKSSRRKKKKKMTTREESLKVFVPNHNNRKKKKKNMQKWWEMDGNRGKLTSTSTHPEKDKENKSGIHRLNNRNKVNLDVSTMVLGSVLKRCGELKKKPGQLKKKKKLHGKSKKALYVPGILKNQECAEKDELPNVLDITKCRRVKHHVKRVSFREEEQPETEPPASDNNIAVLVVDGDGMGISTSGGDHGKREEEIDLNHSLMPSCSEPESFEPGNCHSGSLHGISNQVELEQETTGSSMHENHTFRRHLSPSACVSVPTSSAMISEPWESSEDRLWNHCAFNPNPYFQVPYKPLPFGVRDAESVNPQHTYRDFFSGLPLNSHGDLIERQASRNAAFSFQNYIKPTCNQEMKDQSLLFPNNLNEISVIDMNGQEQTPNNEYDHHQHACRLRSAGQIIPGKETSGSSDRPTMRLMGKNFTVGKSIQQLHGSENGQVWTDKEIIAEQKQKEKQNGVCSSCFSGGVGRSSCLKVDGHLGIEEAQPPPMIGNYFYNDGLQHPSENHFSAVNFFSSHGRNVTATSSHRYHHHRHQSLTGRTPSSANSHAFLNQNLGLNRSRHEFPTHNLQQWLMDTSPNFAPPYHTQFYDQYHHHHIQHPRTTYRPHNLHPFSTPPHFPPPPQTPPNFPMTSSSANIPFIPQFPVVKPDSLTDLDNWKHRMSRITCLEEPDRIMKKFNHDNPAAKKPNSLSIACHDHVVDVEQVEEEERVISARSKMNGGWAERGDKVIDVGNINVSTSRFGGPIKLCAGAKHILKPCQKKMDSDNTRLTYSTRPFALMNETAPSLRPHPVAMKKSARIYQF